MSFPYNSTGISLEGGYAPAPEGEYDLIIKNASDTKQGLPRTTKNGDPYVNVECEIENGDHAGKKVFHNVTFLSPDRKGAGIAVQFLKYIGEPWEGEFEVNPDNWIGRSFRAKLTIGKDLKGRPKNEIAYIKNPKEVESLKTTDDEVPF